MWNLNAGGIDTGMELFGDDRFVVQTLAILPRYQVEVMKFSSVEGNKFRILRFEEDASTPKFVWKRKVLAEFDDVKEFVAMVRLIVASEVSHGQET